MPAILGGGIGGLSAGYYLAKRFVDNIVIYEASNRLGGWIQSEHHLDKGFIFESGPRTIRPRGIPGANTLEMIEDLGLEQKVNPIFSNHPAAKNRMIYVNNELCPLPSSLMGLFKTIPPFTKPLISSILNDFRASKPIRSKLDDESIYGFVERRFGSEIAEFAISPMICGICAGDAKEISVRFLMNDIFEVEQKYGGVLKGLMLRKFSQQNTPNPYADILKNSKLFKKAQQNRWSIYSLEGGLEVLPSTIAKRLQTEGVDIKTSSECKEIYFDNDRAHINLNGNKIETDYVISSIPSFKLAQLLENQHPTLSYQLKTIPYVDVAVVNVQYDSLGLLKEEAFGLLVPPNQKMSILGIIFDSCCFNMHGNTVLTVMMGGKWFQEYFGNDPRREDILNIALKHIKKILNIEREPTSSKVNILKKCIPQYTVGHRTRVQAIRNYILKHKLPISICGSSYDGVGVNDVILSAKTTVFDILNEQSK